MFFNISSENNDFGINNFHTIFSFLVLNLFYRSQMVNFKEIYIYHFSRFQRGSNIFQGGGSTFSQGGPIAYSL